MWILSMCMLHETRPMSKVDSLDLHAAHNQTHALNSVDILRDIKPSPRWILYLSCATIHTFNDEYRHAYL